MPELSDDQLAEIRRRYAVGLGILVLRLAAANGVSPDCIEAIVHGRPWRHLAEREEPVMKGLFDGEG